MLLHGSTSSPLRRVVQAIPPERPGKPMLRLRLLDGDHLSLHREDDPDTVARSFCSRRALPRTACAPLVHYLQQAFSPVARKMVSGLPAKLEPSPKWTEPPPLRAGSSCGCTASPQEDSAREAVAPRRGRRPSKNKVYGTQTRSAGRRRAGCRSAT